MSSELEYLSRPMIELRGVHGANNSDVVYDLRGLGEKTRKPSTRLAILLKLPRRLLQFRCSSDESETLTIDQTLWNRFLISFGQCGLVVEHINMGYAAGLIQINDALCLGGEVKWMNAQSFRPVLGLGESVF